MSYLVKNPEDRFSRDEAHMVISPFLMQNCPVFVTVKNSNTKKLHKRQFSALP